MSEQVKSALNAVKDTANAACGKAADVVASATGGSSTTTSRGGEKALLGYWSVRGLAGYIRLMLTYCNEPFEEKIYSDFPESIEKMKEARETHQGGEWFREKSSSELIVPNIPYLYIDGKKISQSRAIMRYMAKKHHLEGKNANDQLNIDQIDEGLRDFLMALGFVNYFTPKPGFDEARKKYNETSLPENLGLLTKYFDKDRREYVAGNYVTYVDFVLYEYLDVQRLFSPEVVNNYSTLTAYMARIENLPRVKEYMSSGRFMRTPVFAPFANWDGTGRGV